MANRYGKLLRRARRAAGKTMGDVADELGVSVAYVSHVELGVRTPFSSERTEAAARFLGADPTDLLAAAATNRGAFELDAGVGEAGRRAGTALMRAWTRLTPEQFERIYKLADEALDEDEGAE